MLALLGGGVLLFLVLVLVLGVAAGLLVLFQRVRALSGLIPFLPVLRDGLQVAALSLSTIGPIYARLGVIRGRWL